MSTGLYVHRTRNAGETVSAPLYNGGHQTQLQNDVPNQAGAHSDDLTEFQATQDPAPAETPNLVASVSDELEQLRFKMADIKTALQAGTPPTEWYTPVTVPPTLLQARGARVFRNTTQAITQNTATACIFDSTRYDTGVSGSGFDTFWQVGVPTRLTARIAGLYQIVGYVAWPGSLAGPINIAIRQNGTKILATWAWTPSSTDAPWLNISTQFLLAEDEYVELIAYQNASASVNITNPEFGLELLNATAPIPEPAPPADELFITRHADPNVYYPAGLMLAADVIDNNVWDNSAANRMFALPFVLDRANETIGKLAVYLSSNGSASARGRLAIYEALGVNDPYPGALIVDGAITNGNDFAISDGATDHEKVLTVNTALTYTDRLYWLVWIFSGATVPQMRVMRQNVSYASLLGGTYPPTASGGDGMLPTVGLYVAQTYPVSAATPLPSTFPASATKFSSMSTGGFSAIIPFLYFTVTS